MLNTARSMLFVSCAVLAVTAAAEGPRIDLQTSGATRGQPAGGATGETAGAMQGPMAPDRNAVEVAPAGMQPCLTDVRGRALYMLEGENAGKVRCDAACARVWPPLRDEANLAGKGLGPRAWRFPLPRQARLGSPRPNSVAVRRTDCAVVPRPVPGRPASTQP